MGFTIVCETKAGRSNSVLDFIVVNNDEKKRSTPVRQHILCHFQAEIPQLNRC